MGLFRLVLSIKLRSVGQHVQVIFTTTTGLIDFTNTLHETLRFQSTEKIVRVLRQRGNSTRSERTGLHCFFQFGNQFSGSCFYFRRLLNLNHGNNALDKLHQLGLVDTNFLDKSKNFVLHCFSHHDQFLH